MADIAGRCCTRAVRLGIGVAILSCAGGLSGVPPIVAAPGPAWAHEKDLPAGPIRERHELMEGIGKHAKALHGALKGGDRAAVAKHAAAIAKAAGRIVPLFPAGSSHPKSRAKAEIWQDFTKFEAMAGDLGKRAAELAHQAGAGGDLDAGGQAVGQACKACHDAFRKPKKKKGSEKS